MSYSAHFQSEVFLGMCLETLNAKLHSYLWPLIFAKGLVQVQAILKIITWCEKVRWNLTRYF